MCRAGWCIFNDLAVGARAAQRDAAVGQVLMLDLDVHQGDGSAAIFAGRQQPAAVPHSIVARLPTGRQHCGCLGQLSVRSQHCCYSARQQLQGSCASTLVAKQSAPCCVQAVCISALLPVPIMVRLSCWCMLYLCVLVASTWAALQSHHHCLARWALTATRSHT